MKNRHQKVVSAIRATNKTHAFYAMAEALTYAENRMKDALGLFKNENKTVKFQSGFFFNLKKNSVFSEVSLKTLWKT